MKTLTITLLFALSAPILAAEPSSPGFNVLLNQGITLRDGGHSYSDMGYNVGVSVRPDKTPIELGLDFGQTTHRDNRTLRNHPIQPEFTSTYDISYYRVRGAYIQRIEPLRAAVKFGGGAGLYQSYNGLNHHMPNGVEYRITHRDTITSPFLLLSVTKDLLKSLEFEAGTEYNLVAGRYGFSRYRLNGFSVLLQLSYKLL